MRKFHQIIIEPVSFPDIEDWDDTTAGLFIHAFRDSIDMAHYTVEVQATNATADSRQADIDSFVFSCFHNFMHLLKQDLNRTDDRRHASVRTWIKLSVEVRTPDTSAVVKCIGHTTQALLWTTRVVRIDFAQRWEVVADVQGNARAHGRPTVGTVGKDVDQIEATGGFQ